VSGQGKKSQTLVAPLGKYNPEWGGATKKKKKLKLMGRELGKLKDGECFSIRRVKINGAYQRVGV